MKIAIPSYRRANSIFEFTIASLIRSGVDLKDVTVFISDPSEHDAYVKATGGMVDIVDSVATLGANRTFIMNYYPVGEHIVMIDDDIKGFEKLVDGKLVETNFYAFAKKGFEWCEKRGKTIWGVYAARNPFFMKRRITEGLSLPVGSCYGLINTRADYHIVGGGEKEDYRRGFQTFKVEGGLIRLDYITVNTSYYKGKGGIERDAVLIKKAAQDLVDDYPEYCKAYKSKGKGTWELRLNNHAYKTVVLETL